MGTGSGQPRLNICHAANNRLAKGSAAIEARLIALVILAPFALFFIYAIIHELRRYSSEGSATYGLVYDEKTGTTHVTGIAEDEEGYDPEEFDPGDHNEGQSRDKADDRA